MDYGNHERPWWASHGTWSQTESEIWDRGSLQKSVPWCQCKWSTSSYKCWTYVDSVKNILKQMTVEYDWL